MLVCAAQSIMKQFYNPYTVRPALSGHSKIDKTKVLKANGS